MAEQNFFVGIDIGGTTVKAAIYDAKGREYAVASTATELFTPAAGRTERDMDDLYAAVCTVVREVVSQAGAQGIASRQIQAVACTGHGKGLYLWGQDDRPLGRGIISTDRRAAPVVERWQREGLADAVYDRICQRILVSQPCALLRWFKEYEPATYSRIKYVFEAKDYIRFRLTGEPYGEITDYSGTSLVNLHTGQYDASLFAAYGIGEMLACMPPLCRSDERCGSITADAAARTGLMPGIPAGGGLFDIDACALATGLVDEADICVIAGTWSINEYISRQPVTNGSIAMNSLYCLPGYYLIEESSPTSAGNLEWLTKRIFDQDRIAARSSGQSVYQVFDQMVESYGPEQENPVFLPYVFGGRTNPLARGAIIGLESSLAKAGLIRAFFEGIVFSHKAHLDKLLPNRTATRRVKLSGGAANSQVWSRMFADIIGLPVEVVKVKEPGALGSAMCAAAASGLYASLAEAASHMKPESSLIMPDDSVRDIYMKKYERFCRADQLLDAFWT